MKFEINLYKSLYASIFFLLTSSTFSQVNIDTSKVEYDPERVVVIYETSEDYLMGSGKIAGEYTNDFQRVGRSLNLRCAIDDTSVVDVKVSKCWGFSIGNNVFRITSKAIPYHVYSIGKVVYYENGFGRLKALDDGIGKVTFSYLFSLSIYSFNLDSKLMNASKASKLYKKNRPDLKELCDCIDRSIEDAQKDNRHLSIVGKEFILANRICAMKK